MLKEDEDETLTFEIIDFTMENKKNLVKIQQKKKLTFQKEFQHWYPSRRKKMENSKKLQTTWKIDTGSK